MTKSYKSIKIEIKPTKEQIEKINKTIGTGRFLYNLYISYNIEQYKKDKTFITAFVRQIGYKADWYGKVKQQIDTYYASSQICGECGYKNSETKDLSVREWICPQCGKYHDRDENASNNILKEGLRLLSA